ncbi:RluA family pseudouridine synthase [Flaviflexus massiliensis]|uniref:RluA family pseudouridine synthase n=1 Tax=Flaviflexus massiliensis TaxID=1522309 RepID=UPI0006D5AD2B|nr:RluA family pseudouridine synthase [Flaviflexus massiliensis]
MSELRRYFVPEGLAGERADVGVARLTGLTRSKAGDLIDEEKVRIGGLPVQRSRRLLDGEGIEVEIPAPEPAEPVETPVDMDVVFQDDDIIVIDKPAGVAAHPSVGWEGPNVVGALRAAGVKISSYGPSERKGIVHRLDVGTSGLMVVAKSEQAYTVLKRAFKERTVSKIYHVLVQGHPFPAKGTIDAPIARDTRHSWKMGVVAGGRASITHYDTIETLGGASLLKVDLETGRTHQIRVHMSAVHHPAIGDPLYGSDPTLSAKLNLDRQWLHATELSFAHPRTGDGVTFHSDYPADLQYALDRMREGDLW